MPQFQTRRRVAFTPAQMFALVADVEKYPEFLPLCEGLVVQSRAPHADGERLVADMYVGYGAIKEKFTSEVLLEPSGPRVIARYLDGPFKQLDNRWSFVDAPGGCDVDFFIAYEFKSLMLQMLVGAVFDQAFRKFTDAFEARAQAVYGRGVAGT